MIRIEVRLILVVCLLIICMQSWASVSYYGSLTSTDGGLIGVGAWIDPSCLSPQDRARWTAPTLEWNVMQIADSLWRYEYTVNVYKYGVSHISVETSPSFTPADLINPQGEFGSIEMGWLPKNPGSPNIPERLHGIKFDDVCSGTTLVIRFDSPKEPVWGDIYVKGGQTELWNAGFVSPDVDPLDPARNGSVGFHVLVPDTNGGGIVPEPGSWLLLGTGISGLLTCLRRKSRK